MEETVNSPQWDGLMTAILVGTTVGIVLYVIWILMKGGSRGKVTVSHGSPFGIKDLLENQLVVERLTLNDIISWIDVQKSIPSDKEVSFIVGYVNEKTLPLFCVDQDVDNLISRGTYWFMEAFESDGKKPIAVKLVNCHEVDEEVLQMVAQNDYALFKEN